MSCDLKTTQWRYVFLLPSYRPLKPFKGNFLMASPSIHLALSRSVEFSFSMKAPTPESWLPLSRSLITSAYVCSIPIPISSISPPFTRLGIALRVNFLYSLAGWTTGSYRLTQRRPSPVIPPQERHSDPHCHRPTPSRLSQRCGYQALGKVGGQHQMG